MKFSMKKVATAAMATVAVLAMSAGSALAAPGVFRVQTNAIPGTTTGIFQGDGFSGISSDLITTIGNTHTGSGFLRLNALNFGPTPVLGFGPLGTFNLFINFQLKDTYQPGTGGGIDTINSANTITTLNFQVFADPSRNDSFVNASLTGPNGTNATVTDGSTDDILLAFGSLINGVDGFNSGGGAHLNAVETFNLCTGLGSATGGTAAEKALCISPTGKNFFFDPNPFFNTAFAELNNTAQGIARGTNAAGQTITAITQASGVVDFNKVPEPGSMALLGIALAGLGVSSRRNKAAKAAS